MSGVKIARRKVDGLLGEMPAVDAANLVLSQRMAAVETLLPMAALQADEHDEYVHQLRVASRRADASLRIFEPFLKQGAFRKARKRLRRIRQAAGAARECDVRLHMLRDLTNAANGQHTDDRLGALQVLIGWVTQERRAAQDEIKAAALKCAPHKLAETRVGMLSALRMVHLDRDGATVLAMTFRELARTQLEELAEKARARALEPFDSQTLIADLHGLRIRAKRVRYAIEVFAPCYTDGLKNEYKQIENMQEALGRINDLDDLAGWLHEAIEDHTANADRAGAQTLSLEQYASAEVLLQELVDEREQRAATFLRHLDTGKWKGVFNFAMEAPTKPTRIEPKPSVERVEEVSP